MEAGRGQLDDDFSSGHKKEMSSTNLKPTKTHTFFQMVLNYVIPLSVLFLGESLSLTPQEAIWVAIIAPLIYAAYVILCHRNYGRLKHVAMGVALVVLNGLLLLTGSGKTGIILKETALPLAAGTIYLFLIGIKHPVTDIFWQRVFATDKLKEAMTPRQLIFYKNFFNGLICAMFFASALLNFILGHILIHGLAHSHGLSASVVKFQTAMIPTGLIVGIGILSGGVYWLSKQMARTIGCSLPEVFRGS